MRNIGNQKIATINKEKIEKGVGKKRPYIAVYVDTLERAASELKNNAFKVFVYFLSNENDFTFGISPQDIANRYGMSLDTARESIKILIDKGYLVEEEKNVYTFYDDNRRKPAELPVELAVKFEKKKFQNTITGEIVEYTFQQLVDGLDGDEEKAREYWEDVR